MYWETNGGDSEGKKWRRRGECIGQRWERSSWTDGVHCFLDAGHCWERLSVVTFAGFVYRLLWLCCAGAVKFTCLFRVSYYLTVLYTDCCLQQIFTLTALLNGQFSI